VRRYNQPRAWLFRVNANLAIDPQRHRSAPTRITSRLGEHALTQSDPALHLVQRDAVRAALLRLPIRQRTALVLRVVYGMAIPEIAAALGASQVAARTTRSRALPHGLHARGGDAMSTARTPTADAVPCALGLRED
jgi:RNA polymerase sigma factor (sigma-70 family)